jgi:hypothetical protein
LENLICSVLNPIFWNSALGRVCSLVLQGWPTASSSLLRLNVGFEVLPIN